MCSSLGMDFSCAVPLWAPLARVLLFGMDFSCAVPLWAHFSGKT